MKMKEIERREKKEKTSSEARKPIINLNCTKPLMGKYSDGKKGVRDCTYDFLKLLLTRDYSTKFK